MDQIWRSQRAHTELSQYTWMVLCQSSWPQGLLNALILEG
jgi:hypothetical protein